MDTPASPSFERLERYCQRLAVILVGFGGLCLVAACALTLISIVGGLTIRPLPGEIELVEALCGLAVFAFLPYCQLRRGHVGVDLLISSFGPRAMNWTQLIGNIVVTGLIAIVTWRHWVGTMDKFSNGETTSILQLPVWWGYAIALVLLIANIVVGLFVILSDIREIRSGRDIETSVGAH